MEISRCPVEARSLLDSVYCLIVEEARKLGVRLDIRCDAGQIWVDPKAVRRILLNLLSNAMKFTKAGGCVRARMVPVAGGVELQVADTGIGIPADQVDRLVRPFEQMESQYARSHGGTGLGLSIVQGLVRLHGGRLSIQSEVGAGTTVTVFLPEGPDAVVAGRSATAPAREPNPVN